MDYDIDRLGSTEFEHMIQALAIAELGIAVSTFGAGADGGREATFEGAAITSADRQYAHWDGYGIVQAKTLRFANDPSRAATDLRAAVRAELDRFLPSAGKRRRLTVPRYYILATNVRLSPVAGSGGLDQLTEELRTHPIKLEGSAVWHYEHICRLLDQHDGVRRTYAGFLTSGDILSQLESMLGRDLDGLGDVLTVHAATQISARQSLKLDPSAVDDESKLELSEIAIDLPAKRDDNDQSVLVVETLLSAGDKSLRNNVRGKQAFGFVVVGGPGQGKSTLGQILCQAYRVGLLEDVHRRITPKVDRAILETRERLRSIGIGIPRNRRWPVFVDLSQFSDELSARPSMTVTEYVAKQLKTQGAKVKASQIESWLKTWPWAIVFDGLDEVPSIESRRAITEALDDFIVQSRVQNWDVLVVCTTRPQGYNAEFSDLEPVGLNLRLLSPAEGLEYGKSVVRARLEDDPESAAGVISRLAESSTQPHSARLMRTPLQVSILAFLLEQLQEVPDSRLALFDGYYRAIYSREAAKAGYLGKLLKRHSEQVDWVHERAALVLQAKAERMGDSFASLPDGAIVDMFRRRLEEQEFADSEVLSLAEDLTRATKERLVLLVARSAGQISFEVRSLQEYMASRALTNGQAPEILSRLADIAPSAYWRNALLLGVGRVYAQRPQDRAAILQCLGELNTNTRTGAILGYGSRLAIELLDDDVAAAVPAHRRSLLALAANQLTRWPGDETSRLSALLREAIRGADPASAGIASDALADAWNSSGRSRLSALAVLSEWSRDDGETGRFARERLEGDPSWRLPRSAQARGYQPPSSVMEVFRSVFEGRNAGDAAARRVELSLGALSELRVPRALSPVESARFVQSTGRPTDALVAVLSNLPVRDDLIAIANAVPIGSAAAAIEFRNALLALDQGVPRAESLGAIAQFDA